MKYLKEQIQILILSKLLLMTCLVSAQDFILQGTVKDTNGELLPGVSVMLKGTNTGTVTNSQGNYSLNISDENTLLIFSYIGYTTQEIKVGKRTVIDIVLEEDIKTLANVIVVGYTDKDEKKLTSAIATVSSETIQHVPMATFDNILQGQAPGLLVRSGTGQPGRAASVTIRGPKSIDSSSTPLYIIDGTEVESSDFKALNPNDISSVSILKDAAATQIYGSRGAFGVIVVTTKQGTKGKVNVKYHTLFGISPRPTYNDGVRPLTSKQLIDLQHEIGIGSTIGLPQNQLDSLKKINTDWLKVTTRDAKMMTHDLTFSGGGEHTTFYISASYFSQEGTSLRSKLDRYSLRTKIKYAKDNLEVGSNVYLAHTDTEDSETEGEHTRSNPFYTSIRANPYDYARHPITGKYAKPLDLTATSTDNILERIENNDENRTVNKVTVSVNGRYKMPFLERLSIGSQLSVVHSQRHNVDYVNPHSFRGNRYRGGKGRLYESFTRRTRFTITNTIYYDFSIGNNHFFDVKLFQEYIHNGGSRASLEVFGLDKIKTIKGATIGTKDNEFIPKVGGTNGKNVLSSLFATIDYSYKDKYDFTVGVRRDGSSRFGANNRFGTFYSLGLGWIVSEESFMSSLSFVNFVKLRASFGTVGNQKISNLATRPIFYLTEYNGQQGIYSNLPNPNLKWEHTKKLNIGLDLALLENFLTLNIDWYNEKTIDLLRSVPLSRTTGFSSQRRNSSAILRNTGVELNIKTNNIATSNIKWTTSLNLAISKTFYRQSNNERTENEKEFGLFRMVKRAGVNPVNGRTLWYDKEGNLTEKYDSKNVVDVGSSIPKFHGGFSNSFVYKGLEISMLFTFAQGHSIFNRVRTSLDNPTKISRGSVSTNALRFWRKPGDITDLPDPHKLPSSRTDSGWLEDASYVKFRNAILAFNFPSSIVQKLKISGLRIYAQGQNLYTWTTFSGLDPENSNSRYAADYPSLTTYTFGLEVKF